MSTAPNVVDVPGEREEEVDVVNLESIQQNVVVCSTSNQQNSEQSLAEESNDGTLMSKV